MEFSEDRQFDPIPQDTGMSLPPEEPSADAYPAPDIPVSETPVPESPADTAWHGAGVEQQEFFTPPPRPGRSRTPPRSPSRSPSPSMSGPIPPSPRNTPFPKSAPPSPKSPERPESGSWRRC